MEELNVKKHYKIKILKDQKPKDDISRFCDFVKIDKNKFDLICETHRNRSIWKKENGKFYIPEFLVENFDW